VSRRTGSSQRWRERQERDPYVERTVRDGWRARAVFKLEQIQAKERILAPGKVVIDLGASPGSWSQYAARVVGESGVVIAQDLLPMDPLPGIDFVPGDFTDPDTVAAVQAVLAGRPVDLVMSDMAPNISGNRVIDQPRSIGLADDALMFAEEVLKPSGDFLVKLFQGSGFDDYVSRVRTRFSKAKLVKPKASRPESREIYLLARDYRM
jgi:23S rRNA (uridine2552-2'-O)-methyltransferase